MNSQEKMLERVRRLLRLAEGASNANEAAAAAAAAQKLIEMHRLDQAMLDIRDDRQPVEEPVERDPSPLDRSKTRVLWKGILANSIAAVNNCKAIGAARGGNIEIIGTASNIATVRYLYAYFVRQVDVMADGYAGYGRAWIHAWRAGCAETIAVRLRDAQAKLREDMLAQHAGGGSALALVHAGIARVDAEMSAVTRYMGGIPTQKIKAGKISAADGFVRGRLDGYAVNIDNGPALGQGAKANIR